MSELDTDSPLVQYAVDELTRAGMFDADTDYGPELAQHIVSLTYLFSKGGHSGGSAAIAIGILEKLLRFEPLTPLTYAEDEWVEVADGLWQNRRKFDVFSCDRGATWECNDGTSGVRP